MAEHRDYVALEWVKGEIEETLKQAEQALEAYVESPEDGTRMRFCLTYIHQVHGTLQMVEFYGAALLAEEMEKLAQAIINDRVPEVREAQEVLMQAILQLPGYLEHLQAGKDDIPVTLLPLLNDIRSACGESLLTETSLFSPNLLPLQSEGDFSFSSSNASEKLTRLREAYRLGLVGVIRNTGLDKSLAAMAKSCMHLEQLCGEAPLARLWWIAGAIVESVSNETIENSFSIKTLLRQLEKEIGRLQSEGNVGLNAPVPEELAKNLLYYIAKSSSDTPSVRSIRQVFGLTAALPDEQDSSQALQGSYKSAMGSVVSALSEELANLKEQFDLFTRSSDYNAEKLSELSSAFKQISDTLAVLGLGPQRKALLDQYDKINQWIETESKPEQAELMNIASELLMVEVGLNASASSSPKAVNNSDIPIDALNTAQSAVVKECRNGLEQVKDAIISYIASQWNIEEITDVPELLKSVEGALSMVPQLSKAALILTETRSVVEQLLNGASDTPSWDMMDSLADAVAGVDYYLERVTESAQDEGGSVLDVAAESIASITGRSIEEIIGSEIESSDAKDTAIEHSGDAASELEIPELDVVESDETFEALEENSDELEVSLDLTLDDPQESEFDLDSLESADDLSIELELPEVESVLDEDSSTENSVIPELSLEEESALDLDSTLVSEADAFSENDEFDLDLGLASDDDLASMLTDDSVNEEIVAPVQELPSADHEPNGAESDDMIDDEIIEIFVEEAEEVQQTIAEFLPQYRADYDNVEAQAEVRRAFHTLKGSGRLVGAEQVGELSWKVENMLNRIIDKTFQVSPDVFLLIDDVCAVIPDLVAAFARNEKAEIETQPLMDAADALISGKGYQPSSDEGSEFEAPEIESSELDTPEHESSESFESSIDEALELDSVIEISGIDVSDDEAAIQDSLTAEAADLASEDLVSSESVQEANTLEEITTDTSALVESELTEASDSDVVVLDRDEVSDLLNIFKAEALTHLEVLDQYTDENVFKDTALLTDDVQRALHTLKGSAHMAGITAIADFAGNCERIVKEARAARLLADQALIHQLKEAADWIREAVCNINDQGEVSLDIDAAWLDSFNTALSRLPSEITDNSDSTSESEADTSPDHQMMNIFLMEGMDILGDIELIAQQWREDVLNTQLAGDLEAEFNTLAKAARMARLVSFSDVAEALARLTRDVSALAGTPNTSFFTELDNGYEALVSLMDYLAAGQSLAATSEHVSTIDNLSRMELIDALDSDTEVPLEGAEMMDLGLMEVDALELTDSTDSHPTDDLVTLEGDLSETDLSETELASDDDLAALVDEFDEFGGVQSDVIEEQANEPEQSTEEEDSELVGIFLEEADDIVSHLDENLQQWRSQSDQDTPVQELQRAIHTLKGGARLAEIKPIGDLCHELENLYEGVSEGRLNYSESLVDLLQECNDAIAEQVSNIHQQREPNFYPELEQKIVVFMSNSSSAEVMGETDEMVELKAEADQALSNAAPEPLSSNVDPELVEIFLEEAEEILESITEQLETWADAQDDLTPVSELQRELHTLKGGARMAELAAIGDLGHELENLYEGLVNGQFKSSEPLIELLRTCHDRLADMIDDVQAQRMPMAAQNLIDAITQYCQSGSYDDAVLAGPSFVSESELENASAVSDIESVVSEEVDSNTFESDAPELETLDADISLEENIESDGESLGMPELEDITGEDIPVTGLGSELDLGSLGLSALDEASMEVSGLFAEEAADLSEALEIASHAWSQEPYGTIQKDEVLRLVHTLKGGAKLAQLELLADASHDLETYIESRSDELGDLFFNGLMQQIDKLQHVIEDLSSSRQPHQTASDETISSDMLTMDELADLDESSSDALDFAQLDDALAENEASGIASFEVTEEQLLDELSHLDEDEEAPDELVLGNEIEVERIPAPEFGPSIREALIDQSAKSNQEAVKVSSDLLENLVNLAGETSISRGRLETEISDIGFTLEDMDMTVSRLREQLKRLDLETQAQISYRTEMQQSHDYDDFDPLEMDRYTNMQQLSRALLESVTDILDLRSTLDNKVRDSETLLLQQSRINTELQEGLMRTRMVPFSRLVPRLRRIVRQISQELGKQVDFKVHNADGEMDRTVLERMVAPLEHMLRNAVDHGIEMPEVRKNAGKKAKGLIELSVGREGGDVVLTLKDDGAGVNLDAVRTKAVERNLMKDNAVLTDHEVMQFIFSPGFSTAQKVTQISGRGVGMDVVNSEIKQLGGNISIDSSFGKGSHFDVRLPFTVSVNRALMVKVGDDLYAVPLNTIEGIVRVSPYELEEFYKEGADMPYMYADKEYRMEYMGTLLKSGHKPKLQGQVLPLPVLLVRGAEHPIALQVDSLMGSREVVVKSLGAQFSTVDGVSGATILGDGSVVIILDLAALIRAEHVQSLELAQDSDVNVVDAEVVADRPLRVMVVDDSVTVRKVTTRVLQRQGYEVFTAKDGVDAIAQLQDERPDIMLLDIEMPRMDGFEVASHVRHNEQISDLPIIMITSRTGDKHRDRAKTIGVNHYMGKPFQESVLLETIEQLVGKK